MPPDPIDDAVAEAARRASISDRDLTGGVRHFGGAVHGVVRAWGLSVERWLPGGAGTPPLAVRLSDGSPAVLKIAEPGDLDGEVRVMRAGDGRGYARVLAWDPAQGAVLLERLGGPLWTEAPTLHAQGDVVVPLLREAWGVPVACGRPFEGKASVLSGILADLGPRYGGGHEEVLGVAVAYAAELASSETAEVVCHGDPHAGNVLRRGEGWALIDPDGFVGEAAYDVGVVLRDACDELRRAEASRPGAARDLLRSECVRLARLADVDAERVWRWGFVERVTTALYLRWHGHARESRAFLGSAALLVT